MAIVFVMYLVFFFKVVYPKNDQSGGKKYFPFGLVMVITGILFGAVIYLNVFLSSPFEIDFYLLVTYCFVILLAASFHLLPFPFRGRVVLYGLIFAGGLTTYCFLIIYLLYWISPFLEVTPAENWLLILGLFTFPLTALSIWGIAKEEKYMYKGVSDSFQKWSYFAILGYSIILLVVGYVGLKYSTEWWIYLLTIGSLAGVIISVGLAYRLRRKRKKQGLPW